jgi:DNA repair protein RadA/Sms
MATVVKKQFFCTACGNAQSKWFGKCPSCNEWSTCSEEIVQKKDKKEESRVWREDARKAAPILMQNVQMGEQQRIETPDAELNRVLGGGIVGGSLILLGGEPGIGKSTLMLQVAMQLNLRILYVSGEESEEQIKMRAERIGINNKECYLLTATDTSTIFQYFKELQPQMLVIDSIQTIQSPLIDSTPGSISQVRECAGELQRLAKETNTPVFVIGHITKEGTIAGPKLLEHILTASCARRKTVLAQPPKSEFTKCSRAGFAKSQTHQNCSFRKKTTI